MPSIVVQLSATALALAAVWWTVVRLPRFWRAPYGVEIAALAMRPERQARALPVLAVLGTPLAMLIAALTWTHQAGDVDGVAPWLQEVLKAWFLVVLVATVGVGFTGRPRFAVAPALRGRGRLRDSPVHAATVHEEPGEDRTIFVAECECGWMGADHPTAAEARAEARAHTSRVRPGVDRLGA